MEFDADYKNALPREVDDHPDSGMPRQLRTQADGERVLSRAEAEAAGLGTTPEVVYADSDDKPNRDDVADEHHGSLTE